MSSQIATIGTVRHSADLWIFPPGRTAALQSENVRTGDPLLLLRHVGVEHQPGEGPLAGEVGDNLSGTEGSPGEESFVRAGDQRSLDEDRFSLVRIHHGGILTDIVGQSSLSPVSLEKTIKIFGKLELD